MKQEALDQASALVSTAVPDTIEEEAQVDQTDASGRRCAPRTVSLFLRPATIKRFRREAQMCGLTQDGMLEVLLDCFTYLVEHNQLKLTVRQRVTNTVPVPKLEFVPRGTKNNHNGH